MSGVREAKREDELRWKKELDTYRGRLNQAQMEVGKKEADIDELRFENRNLKTEIVEIKKDSECMGKLLEDEMNKGSKLDERERVVKQTELAARTLKQELLGEREKQTQVLQANEKLKSELREKQEQLDGELEIRIGNIMESERHEHQRATKEIEREMLEVNRTLATVRAEGVAREKDFSAARTENLLFQRQIKQLMAEKAEIATSLYEKIERERNAFDASAKEQAQEIEDLTEQVRNLGFSLNNSHDRANDFE